jgi:hypothetical protein
MGRTWQPKRGHLCDCTLKQLVRNDFRRGVLKRVVSSSKCENDRIDAYFLSSSALSCYHGDSNAVKCLQM